MTIGVGVEGPSDRDFWSKVLPKHFPATRFDVRSMNGVHKLIREAPQLLNTFRNQHYRAGFILLDYDKAFRSVAPCPGAVLDLPGFDEKVRQEARQPPGGRFLFVCVAVLGLEAWLLADQEAITMALPKVTYTAPSDTEAINAGAQMEALWQQQYPCTALNKMLLAKSVSPRFNPSTAMERSRSFNRFWRYMTALAGA